MRPAVAAPRPNSTFSHASSRPGAKPGLVVLVAPAGSYRIAAYTAAARALGRSILVVSNSEHSLVPEIATGISVDFEDPAGALDRIIAAIGQRAVACVLATDDTCVALASRVAEAFDLPQNGSAAARLTQRKDLGRAALRQAGCRTPAFQVVALAAADDIASRIEYPVVVKPLALAGSRGVIRVDDPGQFAAACRRIDPILARAGLSGFAREHVLVEAYLEGPEYAVEGFIVDGTFRLLTIFDKPEPLTGPFFEETYYLTPSRLDAESAATLVAEVARCAAAYGLAHGPVHAEARLTADGPVLLELASRTIGGQCGQLIEFAVGQSLEAVVIEGMCGQLPDIDADASAGVLMIPITERGILQRVEGLTDALQTPWVRDVEIHISPGYELLPLPEGASYLGFIFAQAPNFDETYTALKSAYAKLRFVTRPNWALEAGTRATS